MKLWGPDENDKFKNRRKLAFWSAIFSLVIWPHELILFNLLFGLEPDILKALLIYVTTLAGTAIGGYLWAAMKDDKRTEE